MEKTMAKHVTALKDILKLEERVLIKLLKSLPLVTEDTRIFLTEIARIKRGHVRAYKKAITKAEKGTQMARDKALKKI